MSPTGKAGVFLVSFLLACCAFAGTSIEWRGPGGPAPGTFVESVTGDNGVLANGLDGAPQTAAVILTLDYATTSTNVSGSTSAAGTAVKPAREDHTHRGVSSVEGLFGDVDLAGSGGLSISVLGQVITFTAPALTFGSTTKSVTVTNYTGFSTDVARSDHEHQGTHNVTFTADSGLKHDLAADTGYGDVTIETIWGTASSDVESTSSAGLLNRHARSDHTHKGVRSVEGIFENVDLAGLGGINILVASQTANVSVTYLPGPTYPITIRNSPGQIDVPARIDHSHQGVAGLTPGGGAALFGTVTVTATAPNPITVSGQTVTVSATFISNPPAPVGSVASPGRLDTAFARADHAHVGVGSINGLPGTISVTSTAANIITNAGTTVTISPTFSNMRPARIGTVDNPGTNDTGFARMDHAHVGVATLDIPAALSVVGIVTNGIGDLNLTIDWGEAGDMFGINSVNLAGSAEEFARIDHTHQGVGALFYPAELGSSGGTVGNLTITTDWGEVGDVTSVATATAAGVLNEFARADHAHAGVTNVTVPGTGTFANGTVSVTGTAALPHTIAAGTVTVSPSFSSFAPLAVGTVADPGKIDAAFARIDHRHVGVASFNGTAGAVTGVSGITPGSGATLTGTVAITATAALPVTVSGQTVTVSQTYSSFAPLAIGNVASPGIIDAAFARIDHRHVGVGGITYGGGSTLVGTVTVSGSAANPLTLSGSTVTVSQSFSSFAPLAPTNVASPGIIDTAFARVDHRHRGIESVTDEDGTVTYGTITIAGLGTGLSTDYSGSTVNVSPTYAATTDLRQIDATGNIGGQDRFARSDHSHKGVGGLSPGTGISISGNVSGGPYFGNLTVAVTGGASGVGSFRNMLLNGSMDVTQRGTGIAVTTSRYTLDRWRVALDGGAGGRCTVNQSTDVPTVADAGYYTGYSLEVDVTTTEASVGADEAILLEQPIEGFVWQRGAQRALSYSFWAKCNKNGTYGIYLLNGGRIKSCVNTFTVASAAWTRYSGTIAASPSGGVWDYASGTGVRFGIALVAGSNRVTNVLNFNTWTDTDDVGISGSQDNFFDSTSNQFLITNVQVEPGSSATDYEKVLYPLVLMQCYRYTYVLGPLPVNKNLCFGQANSTVGGICMLQYPTEMRDEPATITYSNPTTDWSLSESGGVGVAMNSIATLGKDRRSLFLNCSVAAGLTAGHAIFMYNDTAGASIVVDAEL